MIQLTSYILPLFSAQKYRISLGHFENFSSHPIRSFGD